MKLKIVLLKMNNSKIKVMMENGTPISNRQHFGTDIQLQKNKTMRFKEESRPDGQRDIFKGKIGPCLKRQIYNSCLLPTVAYGAETWALTTQPKDKLAAAQTK